jgi:predicted TPR repeat methyltransferase
MTSSWRDKEKVVRIQRISSSVAKHFPPEVLQRIGEELTGQKRAESALPSYIHRNPLVRWLMFKRLDIVLAMVREVLARLADRRAIGFDFGCGIGILVPFLASAVETLYACDRQLNSAQRTAELFGIHNVVWFKPDELGKGIADRTVDFIVAADVLEHLPELDTVIALLERKLRHRGWLILSGPTENLAYELGRRIAGFRNEYHFRSVFEVENVVRAAGFSLEQSKSLPFWFQPQLFRISLWRLA